MNDRTPDPSADELVFEEAARWFASMRGPDAGANRDSFEAWLAGSAANRAAYNRASEIFALGKGVAGASVVADKPAPSLRLRVFAGVLAAAVLGAALLALAQWSWNPERLGSRPANEAHLVADQSDRLITLADGSLVQLRSGASVKVHFDGLRRLLDLERGEARFTVAHETRPFVVLAGGGSVTARGTIFDVSLSSRRKVSVRLIDGVIDVAVPGGPNADRKPTRSIRLRAGQDVSFMAASANAHGAAPVASRPAADGSGEFDSVRVADLVALANRSSRTRLAVADRSIGERRISGRFAISDADLLAERIAGLLGLAVDRSDPAAIVLRRR